jgi:hypothetical protein
LTAILAIHAFSLPIFAKSGRARAGWMRFRRIAPAKFEDFLPMTV